MQNQINIYDIYYNINKYLPINEILNKVSLLSKKHHEICLNFIKNNIETPYYQSLHSLPSQQFTTFIFKFYPENTEILKLNNFIEEDLPFLPKIGIHFKNIEELHLNNFKFTQKHSNLTDEEKKIICNLRTTFNQFPKLKNVYMKQLSLTPENLISLFEDNLNIQNIKTEPYTIVNAKEIIKYKKSTVKVLNIVTKKEKIETNNNHKLFIDKLKKVKFVSKEIFFTSETIIQLKTLNVDSNFTDFKIAISNIEDIESLLKLEVKVNSIKLDSSTSIKLDELKKFNAIREIDFATLFDSYILNDHKIDLYQYLSNESNVENIKISTSIMTETVFKNILNSAFFKKVTNLNINFTQKNSIDDNFLYNLSILTSLQDLTLCNLTNTKISGKFLEYLATDIKNTEEKPLPQLKNLTLQSSAKNQLTLEEIFYLAKARPNLYLEIENNETKFIRSSLKISKVIKNIFDGCNA